MPETTGPEPIGPELIGPELIGPELIGPELIGPELIGPELIGGAEYAPTGGAMTGTPDGGGTAPALKAVDSNKKATFT